MHVLLVSSCQKRAWPRSRAILDSYALRVGERTWSTPITAEGLGELKLALRRKATRQTAVACYKNEGIQRMKLLWIVGSRHAFGPDGHYPSGFTRLPAKPRPAWLSDVSLAAQVAGYLHDWGKSGEPFAISKLKAAIEGRDSQEAVRHEWVSLCLVQEAMRSGFSSAWKAAASPRAIQAAANSLEEGVNSPQAAIAFIIGTHHRLFGARWSKFPELDCKGHTRDDLPIPISGVKPAGAIDPLILQRAEKCIARLQKRERPTSHADADYWRPVAILARAALILADHQVSAQDYGDLHGKPSPDDTLFANTKKDSVSGIFRYDQPLNWHLRQVAEKAADIAYRMATTAFEPLAESTVEAILEPSQNPRFRWQDDAVTFIQERRASRSTPALIFNTAGTGAGKTRANAKMACAISASPRFNVALNLRSLTLQTGDSLKGDLALQSDELGVVIGDTVTRQLHAASRDAFSVADEEADLLVMCEPLELPAWLEPFDRNGKAARLLLPPVLVSTIDFIINAGEPGRQGHHVLALLRVMHSDLILDELDSYDPGALAAVLRLIQVAAMLGRSIICSSATLPLPVALSVFKAYHSGLRMHAAMNSLEAVTQVFMVDDRLPPNAFEADADARQAETSLKAAFIERQQALLESIRTLPVYRMPMLAQVGDRTAASILSATETAARQLHTQHQWGDSNRQLSFGLVRVANIKTALRVARHLAAAWPEAQVACYHSNELRVQRYLKERRLDQLLTRKSPGGKHILNDPEIQSITSRQPSTPFIVVATPVEEVGRDHDFDWAVIEPSSAHSIVQTCGRVNRHRLAPVDAPNVAILEFNMRYAEKPDDCMKRGCFIWPGLEAAKPADRYRSSRMSELIDWQNLDRIDASLRFGRHPIAEDEDRLLDRRLREPIELVEDPIAWICSGLYNQYPLRERSSTHHYRLAPHPTVPGAGFILEKHVKTGRRGEFQWVERSLTSIPRHSNTWLSWSLDELEQTARDLGIDLEDAFAVDIAAPNEEIQVIHDEGFGFTVERMS